MNEEGNRGWFFSFFFFVLEVKNAPLYTKVYHTHAQILSEANFAKRSFFVRAERSGVLFRTRRK